MLPRGGASPLACSAQYSHLQTHSRTRLLLSASSPRVGNRKRRIACRARAPPESEENAEEGGHLCRLTHCYFTNICLLINTIVKCISHLTLTLSPIRFWLQKRQAKRLNLAFFVERFSRRARSKQSGQTSIQFYFENRTEHCSLRRFAFERRPGEDGRGRNGRKD